MEWRPWSARWAPFLAAAILVSAGRRECSQSQERRGGGLLPQDVGLCARPITPAGYPCEEHTVETEDGYLLAVQHIPHGRRGAEVEWSPPVFLQHGLFMAGDAWFLNPPEDSLGYLLADHGFDVWVGNVRGTHWSYGHTTLSEKDADFWDWSWDELAEFDLMAMLKYIYSITNSKLLYVGHSQGTIMALAALTMPSISEMITASALLCPISYLDHITSPFVLRAVSLHLDQILLDLGIHQLNFRSSIGVQIMDSLCNHDVDCSNMLSSITGENCCLNGSRINYYLEYEPHPSSMKNMIHLFQMIRKGTFAKYDYGFWKNLKKYRSLHPPSYDLGSIPKSLSLWMGYGGRDALADDVDLRRTISELPVQPQLLYLDLYGHIDFLIGTDAKSDVYGELIRFLLSFRSLHSAS